MKITIIAVGKLKEKFWKDACAEYAKRLCSYVTLNIIEVPDVDPKSVGGIDSELKEEAKNIISKIPSNSYKVALAINGEKRSSEDLSNHFQALTLQGHSHFVLIIGGSCGLNNEVLDICDERLSFGEITMPHNIARVVLLEQIYRSFKIARGESYHK